MSSPFLVKISRDGKEIGTYEAKEAVRLLVYGTLKETDFYWHEGMTEWAPLSKLQASEARRQLAERALQQKQEEAIKAEQLAQEKDKAKEEEDRAVTEAIRIRLKKEKANRYRCHSCREDFVEPETHGGSLGCGVALILGSGIVLLITYSIAVDSYRPSFGGIGFGSWLMSVSFFVGLSLLTVSRLRSPCCPSCESTNFSRPEKTDDQK
jgi:transposase-like protein